VTYKTCNGKPWTIEFKYTYICLYVCMYVCMCVCVCIYIYSVIYNYTGCFTMFSMITNIYNKKLFYQWVWYGLNTKRLCRTLHTVVFDIDSSLVAVPINFFGQCRKLAWARSMSYSAVNGQPLDFCLHRHPVSVNCLYHAWMVLSVGGSFAYLHVMHVAQ
jgi:hypothetical protein